MQLLYSADSTACADALYERLTTDLQAGKETLWFMTGGSNVAVDLAVMARLDDELTIYLTVTLTDERFGPYGHADSNWQQLQEQGLNLKQARAFSVLQQNNLDLAATTKLYADNLEAALASAESVVGFYGMGPDGHIAGILPQTPAIQASGAVTSYITDTFTRITTTFKTIERCDIAYVFAAGDTKRPALEDLQRELPLDSQPAQILKRLPQAYVFNDQIGDHR